VFYTDVMVSPSVEIVATVWSFETCFSKLNIRVCCYICKSHFWIYTRLKFPALGFFKRSRRF